MSGLAKPAPVAPPVVLDPTAWVCCDLRLPERTGPGRSAGAGAGRGIEQRLPPSPGPSPQLRGIMTVGARLRSKASSLVGRGPLGRLRRAGDEETDAIVEHLEGEDEDPESQDCEREEDGRRAGTPSARTVHLAALPERYDSLEEPAPGDKPKKRYRRKLKKYGKNVGKAISKGCRYIVIGLQGFAAAYSAPFGVATSVVSFVR